MWALTWYSFWIFVKHQINAINICGEAISAGVMVFAVPFVRNTFSKAIKFATPQINKNIHITQSPFGLQTKRIQMLPTAFVIQNQIPHFIQIEETQQQTAIINTQKQEPRSKPAAVTSLYQSSNGCPKNLDYYTQKPRPKKTPEECITCQNLITCVCLTSN